MIEADTAEQQRKVQSLEAWGFVSFSFVLWLGGGFRYFLFSSLPGEMIQFDLTNIFQMG